MWHEGDQRMHRDYHLWSVCPPGASTSQPLESGHFLCSKKKKEKKKAEGEQGIPLQKAHDNLLYVE